MIKLILEAQKVNYDDFIDRMLQMAKDHPEQLGGVKVPPMAGKMLKLLPQKKKDEMIVQALNSDKPKMIEQAQTLLARLIGPVTISNLDVVLDGQVPMQAILEIASYDSNYIIDNFLPLYYSPAWAPEMLAGTDCASYALPDVQQYMRSRDPRTCQLLIAKSMKAGKGSILKALTDAMDKAGIRADLSNLRIFVR